MDFFLILKEWGPVVALVAYVLWTSWKRERALNRKVDAHEKFFRDIAVPLIERSNQVIAENNTIITGMNQVIQENGLVLQRFMQEMKKK